MTKSNGVAVTNYFSSITFNGAMKVYADDTYVLVLDFDYLRGYSKNGVLKYSIPVSTNGHFYFYFWVKNKQEIMLVSKDKISVYSYSTRALLKSSTPTYELYGNNLVNDGNKLYDVDTKLITYEYKGGTIYANDITAPGYNSLRASNNYLSCYLRDKSLWFNYFDRSRAFLTDNSFSNIEYLGSFLPTSKNPTDDDLYTESGDPNLKVFIGSVSGDRVSKIYVLNISLNKVEFYMLE